MTPELRQYGMSDPNLYVALYGGKIYRARLIQGRYSVTCNGAWLGFVDTVPQAQDKIAAHARFKANRKRPTA